MKLHSLIRIRKTISVLIVTFWFCVGLRTEICDHTEKNGEEKIHARQKEIEQHLNVD